MNAFNQLLAIEGACQLVNMQIQLELCSYYIPSVCIIQDWLPSLKSLP